jgi:hypothetical protein
MECLQVQLFLLLYQVGTCRVTKAKQGKLEGNQNLSKIAPLDFGKFNKVIFSSLLHFSVAKRHRKANTLKQCKLMWLQ